MKILITFFLVSCFGIYEHTDRLKASERAVYKIKIDNDFINEVLKKKSYEISKFSQMIEEIHRNLDMCINKLYKQLFKEGLVDKYKYDKRKFKIEAKKEIKILSGLLKKEVLNIHSLDSSHIFSLAEKFSNLFRNNYKKSFIINMQDKSKKESVLILEILRNFLLKALNLRCIPFLFYLKNINYIYELQKNLKDLNMDTIYDHVINNDMKELHEKILNEEKNALELLRNSFINIKDGKVFIWFENYKLENKEKFTWFEDYEEKKGSYPYITTVENNNIKDKDTFYLRIPGLVNLNLKVKNGVIYYKDFPLRLMKIK